MLFFVAESASAANETSDYYEVELNEVDSFDNDGWEEKKQLVVSVQKEKREWCWELEPECVEQLGREGREALVTGMPLIVAALSDLLVEVSPLQPETDAVTFFILI